MRLRQIWGVVILLLGGLVFAACGRSGDGLVYTGPTELTVRAGEYVPGTPIQFVRAGERGAEMRIEGQEAIKLVGDSLKWSGTVGEDVRLSVNLRILHISEERLITSGVVTIRVYNVQPRAATVDTERPVRYTLPVAYKVNTGESIPGTTIRYVGPEEGKGAKLEGVTGYPYRAIGDSILWDGQLLSNVDLQLNVRVLFFNEQFMQVLGTATVGITP